MIRNVLIRLLNGNMRLLSIQVAKRIWAHTTPLILCHYKSFKFAMPQLNWVVRV